MKNSIEETPLVRKYFDKIETKEDLSNRINSTILESEKNCNKCSFSYQDYKPEYRELFKKELYVNIKNPWYDEEAEREIDNRNKSCYRLPLTRSKLKHVQYIPIFKNNECRELYKQQKTIIVEVGEDNLYCNYCKKTSDIVSNTNSIKDCFENNGTFYMRRSIDKIFYMEPKFIGMTELHPTEEEVYRKESLKRFGEYTGINCFMSHDILSMFNFDYEKAIEFLIYKWR